MTLKVALVGCGKAADMHVSGIQRLPTAQLVAVCDLEPIMAEQLGARFGISKRYADFEEMLARETPDVVHVVTPPQSHGTLVRMAVDAGCHVMVEKPLACDAEEARRLLSMAESRGRKLTLGYTYYFDPAARMLRTLVRDGVMGELVHLESFLGYDLKGAFGSLILADPNHWVRALPGKLFQNLLDHLLNKVSEYVPDGNPLVHACAWQGGAPRADEDLPDELRVLIAGDRRSAYATLSSHSRPVRHTLTFHGTKNTATIDFDTSTLMLARAPSLPGVLGRLTSPFGEGWEHVKEGARNAFRFARSDYHFFSGFHYLVSEFYQCILRDLPAPIPYREILHTAGLVDEVIQQMRDRTMRAA